MKVAIIVDSSAWAIGKLAQAKVKHNPHHTFKYMVVHPRDAGDNFVQQKFLKDIEDFQPQVIHFEYFRTAHQLLEALPELKKYKIILTQHNQKKSKALLSANWEELGVDMNVTHTEKAKSILAEGGQKNISVIKHGIDHELFTFRDKEPEEFTVGYVGRVVPWKGLKEIAEVCYEEKIPLMFMGKMDKADYWSSIKEEVKNWIDFSFMECEDDERPEFYNYISCCVNNSDDGIEEGPLSFFESMFSGVPVITTPNGSAAELAKNMENCLLIPFNDKEALREAILTLKNSPELRKEIANNAWESIKFYTEKNMALEYSRLYNKVYFSEDLVSVILPTYNRKKEVLEILDALKNQTYKNIEIIIGDDGSDEENFKESIDEWKKNNPEITLKYVKTNNDVLRKEGIKCYGLAEARNRAVCEAEGKYLLFLDSRMKPENDAIEMFVEFNNAQKIMVRDKTFWFFGDKGSGKKTFVENFSFVEKKEFVKLGMFNERINKYGGLSQETRERWINERRDFYFLDTAKAKELLSTKKNSVRRNEIIDMKFLIKKLNV